MMDEKLLLWIKELMRFNPALHLMGPAMLKTIEQELEVMVPLLERISEPEIADLGSGSGLSGIPYKVLHPDSYTYLIERSLRKCTFLRHVVEVLGLDGVKIIQQDPFHEDLGRFAALLARSFSPLATLAEAARLILKENGRLYYLYTGHTPGLGPGFDMKEIVTSRRETSNLKLAVFSRLP